MAYSDAEDYIAIAETYLAPLDECQKAVLSDWTARDADGTPSYPMDALHKPRQNGKTFDILCYELPALFLDGLQILHTAHEVKTSQKTFRELVKVVENNPDLLECVERISRTNGKEGIYLRNGGFIEYSARSKSAGRGSTYDILVLDESQELTEDQLAALLPTISASPHNMRQVIYLGTPPGPSLDGSVARRVRAQAMDGSPGTCLYEWSVEECPDKDATFEDLLDDLYATNPALGARISLEFCETEFNSQSIDYFARERLGWWSDNDGAGAKIPKAKWDAMEVPAAMARNTGRVAFGVKFSPDGTKVALAACRYPSEEEDEAPAHVELVAVGTMDGGLSWLTDFLGDEDRADATAAVAMDGKRGQDILYNSLLGIYPRQALMPAGTRGVIAASSMFFDAIEAGGVTHLDTDDDLTESALTSTERPIGGSGGWGFGGDDPTAVEAASLAFWAAKTTKRDPDGGCVVG